MLLKPQCLYTAGAHQHTPNLLLKPLEFELPRFTNPGQANIMEPSLVNPHSSVMVRYQDGERDGWGGEGGDGGWKEI